MCRILDGGTDINVIDPARVDAAATEVMYGADDPLKIREDEKLFGSEPNGHYAHLKWLKDRKEPCIVYPDSCGLKALAVALGKSYEV
jgi:hypothetical protein